MAHFDPKNFESVMAAIDDGTLFERFAQDLLCQILGQSFIPVGGTHDRAIDGLDHCFEPDGVGKTIYQMSVESNPASKVRRTLQALAKNEIDCSRFFYVTNRVVEKQDVLEEKFYTDFEVTVKCRDVRWLRGHVNESEGTLRTYLTFVESSVHSFGTGAIARIVADLDGDPRVFVYLRRQLEDLPEGAPLDDALTDSLILLGLEGTDPDKKFLRNRDEIRARIKESVVVLPSFVGSHIDERLKALSAKPNRRVRHHKKEDLFCLTYETRLELQEKELVDRRLFLAFSTGAEKRLNEQLGAAQIRVKNPGPLLTAVVNRLFKKQGLAFAEFLTNAGETDELEATLDEIISSVVDESTVVPKNRDQVKRAVLGAIRSLIYQGSADEMAFLRKLANSYMMLFLMQCDPKLATYFSSLAGKLRVFVGNSIIVPAISELPLAPRHRRHWNLLVGAQAAGVDLVADRATVSELASHIHGTLLEYRHVYARREDAFVDDEVIAYIDKILIRSYFYARKSDPRKLTFDQFINKFATPRGERTEAELITWLNGTFGIRFIDDPSRNADVDEHEVKTLANELERWKPSSYQAENDARTVLAVYALRQRDNEDADAGIFGYKTWWLSTDTKTQRAVSKTFPRKYKQSCYMRPEFLYNYICLAPSKSESDKVFDVMFPSLLGATISRHIQPDVSAAVRNALAEHSDHDAARVRAILGSLVHNLQTQPTMNGAQVKHYLDDLFEGIKDGTA